MWLICVLCVAAEAKQTQRAEQNCNKSETFGETRSKIMIFIEFSFSFKLYIKRSLE